jgi:NAD(P)-dependent dehydrogenase (short-subunit alcohol dehydrogenase family)
MPTVLVTGAARGIGRATTLRLARGGWDVIAGVRSVEDGTALAAEAPDRIRSIQLDVTSPDDIAALDGQLPPDLNAVVNNAGVAVGGPVEGLPLADWRRQFEVNLFGQVAVTQAVLPRLRSTKGRIVFVSSLSGRVATPMTGAYNASKFALEGMADALRLEVRPWGIRVALIEPAQTDTDVWRRADEELEEAVSRITPEQRELYAKHADGYRKVIRMSQRMSAPADGVAAAIERALTSRRPRARYVVGAGPKMQGVMTRFTPTPIMDTVLSKATGVPRKA